MAYYIVLAIIQACWTSEVSFPPLPLRIAMIAGMFAPVFFVRGLVLTALPAAIMVRSALATEYNYLPEVINYPFYAGIVILAMAAHFRSLRFRTWLTAWPVAALCLFAVLVDFVCTGGLGKYAMHMFMVLLLLPFIRNKNDLHALSGAIISCTALLAVYFLVNYQKYLLTIFYVTSTVARTGWIDPNYFAMMLNQGFFIAMVYLAGTLHSDGWLFRRRILAAACVVLSIAVLLLASRSGFVCLVFNVLFYFCLAHMPGRHLLLAALAVMAVAVVMYALGTFDSILFRFLSEKDVTTAGSRTKIWIRIMERFPHQDFLTQLFGGGYGHHMALSGGKDAHNELLTMLTDYGFAGALLFIGVVLSMLRLKAGGILRNCAPALLYVLSTLTLSPFITPYIVFFIVWTYAFKISQDDGDDGLTDDDGLEALLRNPEVMKAIEEL